MQLAKDRLTVVGVPASPYTRKMLAALRYRRIPHVLITRGEAKLRNLPGPKVPLLPTLYREGKGGIEVLTDTSPLIRRFETEFEGRSLIPHDPAMALIDMLLEDYGDEWLTKAMFHYRWTYQPDIQRSQDVLPLWSLPLLTSDADAKEAGERFGSRQIERLRVVGSNAATGPVIEASYERFVEIAARHLSDHAFFLGARPSSCDFGIYGQLTQLAMFDPTPMELTLQRAPRVHAWAALADDLSGLEPGEADWFSSDTLPDTLRNLMVEVGRTYVPVMIANARAASAGEETFSLDLDGTGWEQRTFPYQAKCVRWLREAHAVLGDADRERFDTAIAGTGCEALFLRSEI